MCVCVCVCHKRDTFGIQHCDLGTSRHMFDWASVAVHSARPHAPSTTLLLVSQASLWALLSPVLVQMQGTEQQVRLVSALRRRTESL